MTNTDPQAYGECIMLMRGHLERVGITAAFADDAAALAAQEITTLRTERDRLAAVVAKLPTTADGVPITPGMIVHVEGEEHLVVGVTNFNACDGVTDGQASFASACCDCHPDCDKEIDAAKCYATRPAADAGKGSDA